MTIELKREPQWLELGGGVAVHVRPLTTAMMLAAREQLDAGASANRVEVLVKSLARQAITDWRGIPDPVTSENVDAMLDHWALFEAFEAGYFAPSVELDAEKNG